MLGLPPTLLAGTALAEPFLNTLALVAAVAPIALTLSVATLLAGLLAGHLTKPLSVSLYLLRKKIMAMRLNVTTVAPCRLDYCKARRHES